MDVSMSKPCEYCGTDLPQGVNKSTRQIRSRHFDNCAARAALKRAEVHQARRDREWDLSSELESGGFTAEQAETLVRIFGSRR